MPTRPEGPFTFHYRSAADWGWGGMLTQGDPSANPPNRPRLLVNARLKGGNIYERAGQVPFNSTAFNSSTSRVTHLADFWQAAPLRLWMIGVGCPGVSASAGYYLAHLDPEQDPEYQRAVHYSAAAVQPVVASYLGDIYIAIGGAVSKLQLLRTPSGTENLAVAGGAQQTPGNTSLSGTVTCMCEFDGKLFIGLDNGAGASSIVHFDGVTYTTDVSAINAPTCMAVHYAPSSGGDALYVGFGTATNAIKYRPAGDGVGTYTAVTPGAGTLGALEMLSLGNSLLFIASSNGAIWTYDGSSLAVAHTPASASAVYSLTERNGVLYFSWTTGSDALVGSRSVGGLWTDTEKSITAAFGNTSAPRVIRVYRECLYVAAVRSSLGRVYVAPLNAALSGTWYEIQPDATLSGAISGMVVV